MEHIQSKMDSNCTKKRKGVRNDDSYKRNMIKKAKIKGLPHTNHAGKEIRARQTGSQCNCKKRCFGHFTEYQQIDVIQRINGYDTKNEQDIYLQGLIQSVPIQRRRPRSGEGSTKANSFIYNVVCDSERIKVCRNAFIALHGITAKRVRRLCTLLSQGKIPKEKRGKHRNGREIAGEELRKIHEHIESFPVHESHYSSRDVFYLDARLNVTKMYGMFKEQNPTSKVSYKYYTKYFRDNFSLSFGQPQVDTCSKCEQLSAKLKNPHLTAGMKGVAETEKLVHLRKANKFHHQMKLVTEMCAKDDSIAGIVIDFMQNVPLPHIPVQEIFYLRQLWVFVCNIHDLRTGKSVFYIYHEGQAHKGPNEVCSLILDYIATYIKSNVRELHVFSDGCPGQNRNNTVSRFMMALTDTGRFQNIHQYFPQRGHSYLPCDRNFAVVKRAIKHIDRIYTPKEYVEIIVSSSAKNNFEVKMVDSYDILDFKGWWPSCYKRTATSLETSKREVPRDRKEHFTISKYYDCTYTSDAKGTVSVSEHINGLIRHTFYLSLPYKNDIPTLPTRHAYPEGHVAIRKEKLLDIAKCKQYVTVSEEAIAFYEDVLRLPVTMDNH